MAATLTFKKGDDLEWVVNLQENSIAADITGWVVTSQIRDTSGTLIATLTTTVTDAPGGVLSLTATDTETATWQSGTHNCDIQVVDDTGIVMSTETFSVVILDDITQ